MTTNKRPTPEDYRPYHQLPAFSEGITAYKEGRYNNPYTGPFDGVAAQAWDRGAEYAMRLRRELFTSKGVPTTAYYD
jgi:hypothetical protein